MKVDPLRMSPRSMITHLSIEQERQLKKMEAKQLENQVKRANDVDFFSNHINKKKPFKSHRLGSLKNPPTSHRRHLNGNPIVASTGMAAQAYLPGYMKKALRKK